MTMVMEIHNFVNQRAVLAYHTILYVKLADVSALNTRAPISLPPQHPRDKEQIKSYHFYSAHTLLPEKKPLQAEVVFMHLMLDRPLPGVRGRRGEGKAIREQS